MKTLINLPDSDLQALFTVPEFYLTEFSGSHAHFVRMTRETYRRSIFTDSHRVIAADEYIYSIGISDLLKCHEMETKNLPPLNFIFHIAHCGSTLVSRALDIPGRNIVYREPGPLRQLAVDYLGMRVSPGPDSMWGRGLAMVCALLQRRYDGTGPVIIKANVPVNFILPELLTLKPEPRAILLYSSLESFMLAALKSPQRRQWVKRLLHELAAGISGTTRLAASELHSITTENGAAALWLTQMARFASALDSSANVKSLDCETLFAHPHAVLSDAFAWFGQAISEIDIDRIIEGDIFNTHAKAPGVKYNTAIRWQEQERIMESIRPELSRGTEWVNSTTFGQSLMRGLPQPLCAAP